MLKWIRANRGLCGFVILVVAIAGTDAGYVRLSDQRRHDNCVSRQGLYDGEVAIVMFGAQELGATPAETAAALAHLHAKIGDRPDC